MTLALMVTLWLSNVQPHPLQSYVDAHRGVCACR